MSEETNRHDEMRFHELSMRAQTMKQNDYELDHIIDYLRTQKAMSETIERIMRQFQQSNTSSSADSDGGLRKVLWSGAICVSCVIIYLASLSQPGGTVPGGAIRGALIGGAVVSGFRFLHGLWYLNID